MFRKNLAVSGEANKSFYTKIKSWCFGDLTIATLFAFATYIMMLSCVIYAGSKGTRVFGPKNKDDIDVHVFSAKSICRLWDGNKIKCENAKNGIDLVEEIYKTLGEENHGITIDLQIHNSRLGNVLGCGWLSTTNFSVKRLELIGISDLVAFGEKSFEENPFNNLEVLTIDNCPGVKTLSNKTFHDSTLTRFEFRYYDSGDLTVEKGFLDGIKSTSIFQLNKCVIDQESLENIFSNSVHEFTFKTIDLRHNQLRQLGKRSFSKINRAMILYLDYNELRTIDKDIFQDVTSIDVIHLNNNQLTTLPEGIFDSITKQPVTIHLHSNRWNCNCSLQWFKDFYLNKDFIDKSIPLECANKDNDIFDNVDFCPDLPNNETTPIPTETTTLDLNLLKIDCKRPMEIPFTGSYYYYDSILLEIQSVTLNLYEYDYERADFRIEIEGNTEKLHLLWFDTKKSDDILCITKFTSELIVQNLTRQSTYLLCMLYDLNHTLSPFDCSGLTVPVERGKRAWITQKYKNITIGTYFGVLFVTMLSTSLTVFYMLHQHPHLLKGSKGVVIAKTKKSNSVLDPKQKQNHLSLQNSSELNGYLTPRLDKGSRGMQSSSKYSTIGKGNAAGYATVLDELNAKRLHGLVRHVDHIYEEPNMAPKNTYQ